MASSTRDGHPASGPLWIPLTEIRREDELWPRATLDPGRVAEFHRLYVEEGWEVLPPVEVVPAPGDGYLLADGWHRLTALDGTDAEEVPALILEVPEGYRDPTAFVFERALRQSATSSKPLTRAERRAAVWKLIEDNPEHSDRHIARLAGVDHKTVGRLRRAGNSPPGSAGSREDTPPSARTLARRFFQAMEKVRETRGFGFADAVLGDRSADRLAQILREAYGDRAIEQATTYRAWLDRAIQTLNEDEP